MNNNGERINKYNEVLIKYLNDLVNSLNPDNEINKSLIEDIANIFRTQLLAQNLDIADTGVKALISNVFIEYIKILKYHFDHSDIKRIDISHSENIDINAEVNGITSNLVSAVSKINKIPEYGNLIDKIKSTLIGYFKQTFPNYENVETISGQIIDNTIISSFSELVNSKVEDFNTNTLPTLIAIGDDIVYVKPITEEDIQEANARVNDERNEFIYNTMEVEIEEKLENGVFKLLVTDAMGKTTIYEGIEAVEKIVSYNQLFEASRPGKVVDTSNYDDLLEKINNGIDIESNNSSSNINNNVINDISSETINNTSNNYNTLDENVNITPSPVLTSDNQVNNYGNINEPVNINPTPIPAYDNNVNSQVINQFPENNNNNNNIKETNEVDELLSKINNLSNNSSSNSHDLSNENINNNISNNNSFISNVNQNNNNLANNENINNNEQIINKFLTDHENGLNSNPVNDFTKLNSSDNFVNSNTNNNTFTNMINSPLENNQFNQINTDNEDLKQVKQMIGIEEDQSSFSNSFSFLPSYNNPNQERNDFIKKATNILIEEDVDNKGLLYLKVTEPTGREVIYTGKEAVSMIKNYNKAFLDANPGKTVDTSLIDNFKE